MSHVLYLRPASEADRVDLTAVLLEEPAGPYRIRFLELAGQTRGWWRLRDVDELATIIDRLLAAADACERERRYLARRYRRLADHLGSELDALPDDLYTLLLPADTPQTTGV